MKRHIPLLLIFLVAAPGCKDAGFFDKQTIRKIEPVDFSHVKITDKFWGNRLNSHASTTIAVCIDQIENQTGRMKNFENVYKKSGSHSGIFFDDSDVYKALEGIAYTLQNHPDPELEAKADEWIDKIASAQEADGYINTFYSLTGLEKRWTNMDYHEMYCAGHLTEAAIAYLQATGKDKLLKVAIRMADHMMETFGPEKRHWVPGHEEIELALVKLYGVTKDRRYLDFAGWLLEERGRGHGSNVEYNAAAKAGAWNSNHFQDNKPVREITDITGHAVRAMYLFSGMADIAALRNDTGYISTLDRLWDDVVLRNMYITGGIGSSHQNEGFTEDYDLPNYDAYCETCASIGMVYWNWRMNQLSGDAKYADVLERSMYNGALAGISLAGDRFFYVNPLASHGSHHRQAWYGCACCPSQLSRFIPSVGNYIYGVSGKAVWVNLYIGNTAEFKFGGETVKFQQETNYPWEGDVILSVLSPLRGDIRLRIPGWCKSYNISINGNKVNNLVIEHGYAVLKRKWQSGDQICIKLDMPVEVIAADPRVKEDTGKRAIQRGPLVYCAEAADNPSIDFGNIKLSPGAEYNVAGEASLLNGIQTIKAVGENSEITFIPYYAWDNREAGEMKVWIDYGEY